MLSSSELTTLYQQHRDTRVLSVYVDADQHDFAERDVWRVNLARGLDQAEQQLAERGRDERKAFRAARAAIEQAIERDASAFLPGRAWVGFASGAGMIRGERIEAPTDDLVRWEQGMRIAPYVRALKQAQPILAVVLDRREAALHRYQFDQLEKLDELHADTFIGDLSEIEISKRPTHRTGVRGKTGTDAAKSVLDNSAHKLVGRIVDELREEEDAPLVIGGTREQIAALRRALPEEMTDQLIEDTSLHKNLSTAELGERLGAAASQFSDRRLDALVGDAIDGARSGGAGCLGPENTGRALREQRVRTLLVSTGLQQRDPGLADRMVVSALIDNGASVHLVPREPGDRLDREGEGVGALLHYRIAAGLEPG